MGAVTTDVSKSSLAEPGDAFLPPETPLAMVPCQFGETARARRRPAPLVRSIALRRLLIFGGTALLTGAGGYEMYEVLQVGGVTILEAMVLALFLVLLAWIAFSFMSALAGFLVLLGRSSPPRSLDGRAPAVPISARTAMLFPTYNENPDHLMARLQAMIESVRETGQGDRFDWFLLSDTTEPDTWIGEELAFLKLRRACPGERTYYRHRADNVARKSGNIAEWVRRFGAAYDFMIILDADSLMTGQTIAQLVQAMESRPAAALIQTVPVIVNARSLFSRLQQFAGRLYGPMIAAGNAWWHGSESNYWGHNAIIRTRAFAEEAGLPELRGRKPFGGHILSHDFVEAALMRRAGWEIHLAFDLGGSFEEVPPSLVDFAARDRRWCQGNLQHLAVLPMRGLHWMSRLHLLTGIGAYITAPLWMIFLTLGILISLQAYFVRPEYFPKGFALFPTWPAQDPVLAAWVFAASMGLLVIPKLLAYLVMLTRPIERARFGNIFRVLAAILGETMLAALIAPTMMVFQSSAVTEILAGRDAGWQVQRRGDGEISRREIYRKFTPPTLCGVAMAVGAYAISLPLLLWMSPVIVGLVLAIPIGMLTSGRSSSSNLFATPEDRYPPAVLSRANELGQSAQREKCGALRELRQNGELREQHLRSLPLPARRKTSGINVPLAIAREKIELSENFDEAVAFLDRPETLAVLNQPRVLDDLLRMPDASREAR
jgi:membrane glycosyltransferase